MYLSHIITIFQSLFEFRYKTQKYVMYIWSVISFPIQTIIRWKVKPRLTSKNSIFILKSLFKQSFNDVKISKIYTCYGLCMWKRIKLLTLEKSRHIEINIFAEICKNLQAKIATWPQQRLVADIIKILHASVNKICISGRWKVQCGEKIQ